MSKNFKIFCLIALVSIALASHKTETEIQTLFQKFKKDFKREYSYLEEIKRFNIFRTNIERIASLNSEDGSAEYGITQFSDLSSEEFAAKILLPSTPPKKFEDSKYLKSSLKSSQIPDSFDWRDFGAVTPVKNQGWSGTCWTFSTTGNIEGQWFLAGNDLISLSEEQLVDCASNSQPSTGHACCGIFGGWAYLAYDYIIAVGGLPSEADYPYCVGSGGCAPCSPPGYNEDLCGPPVDYCHPITDPCRQGTLPIAATISDWKALSSDEEIIVQQLIEIGPLAVSLDATYLQLYTGGVFNPENCSQTSLNHAVLMVGYGVDENTNQPYWTIKNTWGDQWGEQGYFRIARGTGECGINAQVTSSFVNSPDLVENYSLQSE